MLTAINTPAVAPVPATAAGANTAASAPGAFARELDRAARQDEPDADAAAETSAPAPAAPAPNARAKTRVAADGKAAERKAGRAATAIPVDSDIESGRPGAKAGAASDGGSAPGDLQALLAGLMAQLPAAHAAPPTPTVPAATARSDRGQAGEAAAAAAGPGGTAALPGQPTALAPVADAAAAAATTTLPAFSLPQAAAAPAAPAEPAPPAPVHQAQVSAAVGTPEFAPGLSAEVTVMLRDGLQEARLQLNPAEMGPITVQIQIEGNSAQINLSAEQAPTRDALQQALPMLAGTLQDSGLTLTGGGVFEQPRPPRDDNTPGPRPPARAGSGADDGATGPAPAGATRHAAPRGAVDLYA